MGLHQSGASGRAGGLDILDDFLTKAAYAALGALVTFLLQIAARRAEQRARLFADRLDEFCEDVTELSEASGAYWAIVPGHLELAEHESRTFRCNHRVVVMAGLLWADQPRLHALAGQLVIDLASAATGGNFQVAGRPAEPGRYISIEQAANELIREVRRYQRGLWQGWLW